MKLAILASVLVAVGTLAFAQLGPAVQAPTTDVIPKPSGGWGPWIIGAATVAGTVVAAFGVLWRWGVNAVDRERETMKGRVVDANSIQETIESGRGVILAQLEEQKEQLGELTAVITSLTAVVAGLERQLQEKA